MLGSHANGRVIAFRCVGILFLVVIVCCKLLLLLLLLQIVVVVTAAAATKIFVVKNLLTILIKIIGLDLKFSCFCHICYRSMNTSHFLSDLVDICTLTSTSHLMCCYDGGLVINKEIKLMR